MHTDLDSNTTGTMNTYPRKRERERTTSTYNEICHEAYRKREREKKIKKEKEELLIPITRFCHELEPAPTKRKRDKKTRERKKKTAALNPPLKAPYASLAPKPLSVFYSRMERLPLPSAGFGQDESPAFPPPYHHQGAPPSPFNEQRDKA